MTRPFRALVRHFFAQFFRVDAGTAEAGFSMAAVLGLLAAPGAIMALLLFLKYSPLMRWFLKDVTFDMEIASLPDKYTFVALSMAVTGLVVVLRWEAMFPDRRDFANLAALPLDSRTLLAARTAALGGFVAVFLACVNLCPTLLFPMIALENSPDTGVLLRFIAAHALAVFAAGYWAFAAFLTLTGGCMALLPFKLFGRIKRYVQFLCIIALALLFLSASAMGPAIESFRAGESVWADWLPVAWFLGLYQMLLGKATGSFVMLGERALIALPVVTILAALSYGLSYRRYYLRIAETAEGTASVLPVPVWFLRFTERTLNSGSYRAIYRFAFRTLVRSDQHTAAFTSIAGLGLALAVQTANTGAHTTPIPLGYLTASLMAVYSVLTGLRLCFGVPSETRASWIFRLGVDETNTQPRKVVRLVMIVFVIPVTLLPSMLFGFIYGWIPALEHIVVVLSASAIVIELLTSEFSVIPFTCSWLPGRENLVLAIAVWTAGLSVFGHLLALVDLYLMQDFARLLVWLTVIAAVLFGMRNARAGRDDLVWSDTRGELDLLRISE
ncbi:MAG: hypothetical protein H7039_23565 [Bryobacteraceae bacterium]|nr:hypothetical protein [Bryobacteraceae bacterium]